MTETYRVEPDSTELYRETVRLSTLAPNQITYHQAALQAKERALQILEQAQTTYNRATAKAGQTLEYATNTLEQLYDSFNKEIEDALEHKDESQFISIIDRYAELYVLLVEASAYPSQPDFDETMSKTDDAVQILRENARYLQGRLSTVVVAYIPLPSWSTEPMLIPAPVLATVRTQEGELALDLCTDSLAPQQ